MRIGAKMLKNYKSTLLVCVVTMFTNGVFAQEVPRNGIVYNTKESNSLTYECVLGRDDKLRCDFIQTSVRKKISKAEFAEKIAQIPQLYKEAQASGFKNGVFNLPSAEDCKMWRELTEIMSGKKQPPNGAAGVAALEALSEIERTNLKLSSEVLIATCDNHSLQSFANLVKLEVEKSSKTCLVSSNKFSQQFKRVKGDVGDEVWVVESKPDGDCGIVRLDVFSAEKNNGYKYWSYTSKKAVTNPKGQVMGMECSKFDQDEYLYSWKSRESASECTYINFSPL